MTSNSNALSLPLKIYKILYLFLIPIIGVAAIVFAVLCCFKPLDGSTARTRFAVLLVAMIAAIALLKLLNNLLQRKNYSYQIYNPKLIRRFNPSLVIPLLVLTFIVALPFYILVVTSIKTPLESISFDFSWWPKEGIDLHSYVEMFAYDGILGVSMARATLNSFVYAVIPTFVGLIACAISAFSFAKLEFPGRKLMYSVLIMTMMMPACVTMTTSYIMFYKYGWTNTPLPLIIPGCFGAAATVMFLREYFMGIPDGILEAARIDGAGTWKSFLFIMLPLGKPALIAQFILGFITKYNDYLTPLIYLNDPQGYTIQIALDTINSSSQDKSLVATACVFTLAPMLLLYILFQKRIISGISMSSGLKG